jgi:predicted O-methyltransferase YrrM
MVQEVSPEHLWTTVDNYIQQLFVAPDEALEATLHDAAAQDLPGSHITPVQGKMLFMLALLRDARHILEIGTLAGYSALWMAKALPDDGHLITLDYTPKHVELARANIARAGLSHKVEVREGDALKLMPQLHQEGAGPFDMIFIDTDNKLIYPELLEWSLHLSRSGTLIIADNTIRHGKILNPHTTDAGISSIQQFNTLLADHPQCTATILQTVGSKGWDGMTLAIVRK